ncbi:MAG: AzlC family ABC transporter permease [Pseudomonadota bacterium]
MAANDRFQMTFTQVGFRRGVFSLMPLSIFIIPFGVAFGVAAVEFGLTPDQAIVMSVLMFSGAAQFAALDLWGVPLPWLSLVLVVLAVNARHIILGAAMGPYVNTLRGKHWFGALVWLSDANFADCYQAIKDGERDAGQLLGGGFILWAVWAVATAFGVFAGSILGNLDRFGVDVVMAAFFAALTVNTVGSFRAAIPVAAACIVAAVTMPILPTGWNVIAAAIVGGLVGAFGPSDAKGSPAS